MNTKPPSFLKMIANFAKASAEYVSAGMPSVTQEEYEERISTCHECPNLIKDKNQCSLCGCFIDQKASWQTAKCPDDPSRWKPIEVGKSGKPINLRK